THPASRVAPTVESLDRTTRAQLVEFHKARYMPDRAALAIAGDVSLAQARAFAESRFGAWKKSATPVAVSIAEPPATVASKIYFVERPNSVQTNLIVGAQ